MINVHYWHFCFLRDSYFSSNKRDKAKDKYFSDYEKLLTKSIWILVGIFSEFIMYVISNIFTLHLYCSEIPLSWLIKIKTNLKIFAKFEKKDRIFNTIHQSHHQNIKTVIIRYVNKLQYSMRTYLIRNDCNFYIDFQIVFNIMIMTCNIQIRVLL